MATSAIPMLQLRGWCLTFVITVTFTVEYLSTHSATAIEPILGIVTIIAGSVLPSR